MLPAAAASAGARCLPDQDGGVPWARACCRAAHLLAGLVGRHTGHGAGDEGDQGTELGHLLLDAATSQVSGPPQF